MATSSDAIAVALRHIKVLATDETATSADEAYCDGILTSLFAELTVTNGMVFTWTLATIPDGALIPLGNLLGAEVAGHYNMQSEPRHRAVARLRSYMFTNDMPDREDIDGDGTVTDDEIYISDQARYY